MDGVKQGGKVNVSGELPERDWRFFRSQGDWVECYRTTGQGRKVWKVFKKELVSKPDNNLKK